MTQIVNLMNYNHLVSTINDVARLASVSPSTARRAIHFPEKLKPQTLKRVQEAIDSLQYEPDKFASALRSGQSKTIGLIVGNIAEQFFAELVKIIANEVHHRGYTLLSVDNEYNTEREIEQLKHFQGSRVEGLIIRPGFGKPNYEYLMRMQERGTAIVELDYTHGNSPFSNVLLNNRQCVLDGVNYLAQLDHKRIAALGYFGNQFWTDERAQAFAPAMKDAGLSAPHSYQIGISHEDTKQDAYRSTYQLMQLSQPPTAIFALTGTIAVGVYKALRELGLSVPKDVSLLSFDNLDWTTLVEPKIDVIEQPLSDLAISATQLVFQHIKTSKKPIERLRFPGAIIRRGSCQPPSK